MNKDELVDAVIREVKRVLAQRGVQVEPSQGTGKEISVPFPVGVAPVSSSVKPVLQPVAAPTLLSSASGSSAMIGSSDMTGKQIITQKDLEQFRDTTISITAKAVITPLAIDYARANKITIKKVAKTSKPASAAALASAKPVTAAVVVSPDFPHDGGIVTEILTAKGFQVNNFTGNSYETAVKKLANAVTAGSVNFGVCIEKTGMEGPIHANRISAVNAVHCRDTYEARAARVDYGANVIVIDSVSSPEAVITGFCGM